MIIEVRDLVTEFRTSRGVLKALDRVSLTLIEVNLWGLSGSLAAERAPSLIQ